MKHNLISKRYKNENFFLSISLLLMAGTIFWYFYSQSDKQLVKEYVKNEYGINVKIKEVHRGGFESSEDEYIVFPKNHHELVFSVIIESLPFTDGERNYSITDNYTRAVAADVELHRLKKWAPDLEKLELKGYDHDEIGIDLVGTSNFLQLTSIHPIDMFNFEEEEFDRFFDLQELIKQSGALIHKVYVTDTTNDKPWDSIELDMENLKSVRTKDEFLLELKKSNEIIASVYESTKWKFEKEKIENERFTFGSPIGDYKNNNYWFQCNGVNEKGECNGIFVRLIFAENSLTEAHVNLEKDLNSIF